MVFLCSCGGLIWENRVHVCGQIRCSCGAIKFNGRGHCCGYTPDYSVPPTNWELYSGYRSFDEWMGSTTWGKRSPSLFNTKNQEKFILNVASSMEDIKNLQQTGAFQDYCKSFDFLLTKVILSEDYATSLFVEGLNSEMKWWVKLLGPKTLKEAYEMANRHNNFLNSINCDKGFKKEIDPSISVHSDEKASESDIRIDEFENRNEIQETCDNIIQEMMVEEVVDNDVLKGNRNANKATLKIFAEMPERFSSESKIQEVVGSDVLEIQEEIVNNVTDKVSLDVKNGDVIDSEEGIKANVKEMFENVIDDDVDKKIENESDDDVKEVEKEPVVDVQRFEWKPGWRYCLGEKSRIIIERDLTEPDRVIGELLQPDYLKLIGLGLEDCIEDIVAQSFFGDALFKDGKNIRLCYPLEKLQSDVVGRSFHNVHIGRNFDEDQRKPLDEGSGPCWTVSDENILDGTSVYVRQEPESDYSLARNVPIRPATTPLFKFRGGSMDGCYAARFSEAVNVKSDAGKSNVMGFLLETSLQGYVGYVGTSLTHAKGGQQGNDNNLAAGSSTATHSFGQQSVEHNFGYQNLIFQSEGYDIWMVPWLDGFANCFTLHVRKGNVDFTTKHGTCIKSEFHENHVASNKVGDEDLTQSGLTIKVGVIEDRTNKKEAIQPATVSYYDEDSLQRMFTRGSCFKQVVFSILLFHQSTTIEELNFDADGYYIKTGARCLKELMKSHKEGFTSVLGAAKSFGQSKLLRVELHFVVATCENMITRASMTSFLQFIFDSFD